MFDRIKTRLAADEGFTLIELLVVIIILGILVAIAVPAYLAFTDKAKGAAAESNVRSAIPAAESWYEDTANNTNAPAYTGLSLANLDVEAPGIAPSVTAEAINGGAGYCIDDTEGDKSAYYVGGNPGTLPSGAVQAVVTSGNTCSDFTFTA